MTNTSLMAVVVIISQRSQVLTNHSPFLVRLKTKSVNAIYTGSLYTDNNLILGLAIGVAADTKIFQSLGFDTHVKTISGPRLFLWDRVATTKTMVPTQLIKNRLIN